MSDLGLYKMHALIVDDFENFRATLHKMLMDIGIGHVDSASTGEDALKYCRVRAYDLIVCDNNLGRGKTGQQVLEQLRSTNNPNRDSVFILISAESSKSIVMAAYDYEPDAYLAKPLTPKALDQRIARLFEQRHELKPVISAQKAGDIDLAIHEANRLLNAGIRHSNACQKLLGQLYLEKGDVASAKKLYSAVLAQRELEWAQLGMIKTLIALNDYDEADRRISALLENNPLCMKAYDFRVELYRAKENFEQLQATLQKAVDISPLSILRQQSLGQVAQQNHDLVTAAHALRRSVKLGENSCFDRQDIHIQFAQTTIDLFSIDRELAKPLLRDAISCAVGLESSFGKGPVQRAESLLLESQLQVCNGDPRRAQEALNSAQQLIQSAVGEDTLDVSVEMIRALRMLGKDADAEKHVNQLLTQHADKEELLQKIDVLLDEPRSEKNKHMVAEINKKGIRLYNDKDLSGAADAFASAIQKLPNHIGLRLNYVQALLEKLRHGFDVTLAEKCQQGFSKIDSLIAPDHPQYQRYRQLNDVYKKVVRANTTPATEAGL